MKKKNFFCLSFNKCGYAHLLGRLACFIKRLFKHVRGAANSNCLKETSIVSWLLPLPFPPEAFPPKPSDHGSLIELCSSPQLKSGNTFKVLY